MPRPDKNGSPDQPHPGWTTALSELSVEITGPVLTVGDEGYRAEHTGFDLSVPQRPAVIVGATTTDDVVGAVRFARSQGLSVAVQATGHGPTVAADGGLLINTRRLDAVEVDPANRSARLGAGTLGTRSLRLPPPSALPLLPARHHRSGPSPTPWVGGSVSSVVASGSPPTTCGPSTSLPPTASFAG